MEIKPVLPEPAIGILKVWVEPAEEILKREPEVPTEKSWALLDILLREVIALPEVSVIMLKFTYRHLVPSYLNVLLFNV